MGEETSAEIKNLGAFLEKNIFTKAELEQRFETLVTQEDVLELKQDLSTLKSQLTSLKIDLGQMKTTLTELNQRNIQDSDVFAKDIVKLQKDVKVLKLKPAS